MNLIKLTITAVAILFSCLNTTTEAENIFDNPDNQKTKIMVRAAYEYDSPTTKTIGKSCHLSSRSGFSAGFDVNIPLWKNLYLGPGLSIYETQTGVEGHKTNGHPISFLWFFGCRVNCLIGYHFDLSKKVSLSLSTGPQLAMGFTSGAHYPGKKSDETLYTKVASRMNRYDCLWNINVATTFKSKFTLGIGLSQGLVNRVGKYYTQRDPGYSYKDRILSVSVGYTLN